jgi:hypothetical protein
VRRQLQQETRPAMRSVSATRGTGDVDLQRMVRCARLAGQCSLNISDPLSRLVAGRTTTGAPEAEAGRYRWFAQQNVVSVSPFPARPFCERSECSYVRTLILVPRHTNVAVVKWINLGRREGSTQAYTTKKKYQADRFCFDTISRITEDF